MGMIWRSAAALGMFVVAGLPMHRADADTIVQTFTVSATSMQSGAPASGTIFDNLSGTFLPALGDLTSATLDEAIAFTFKPAAPASYTLNGNVKNPFHGQSLFPSSAIGFMVTASSQLSSVTIDLTGYDVTSLVTGDAAFTDAFGVAPILSYTGLSGTSGFTATASFTATLTYNFDGPGALVPEPDGFALVGSGLAALGLVRRRQQR